MPRRAGGRGVSCHGQDLDHLPPPFWGPIVALEPAVRVVILTSSLSQRAPTDRPFWAWLERDIS